MKKVIETKSLEDCLQAQRGLFAKGYSWSGSTALRKDMDIRFIFVDKENKRLTYAHSYQVGYVLGEVGRGRAVLSKLEDV